MKSINIRYCFYVLCFFKVMHILVIHHKVKRRERMSKIKVLLVRTEIDDRVIIRCVFFFLSIGRESTTSPANNCLQIMVCLCVVPLKRVLLQIIFCSCVTGTTFSRQKWQIASLSCQEVIKIWKQTWRSNDNTLIELSYRKISRFVSVLQINYLPQPSTSANNWSARRWQITIFCSTSCTKC